MNFLRHVNKSVLAVVHTQAHTYTHTHTYIYIHFYLYIIYIMYIILYIVKLSDLSALN